MQESFLKELSPEQQKRLGYLEGREDLFETKLLHIENKQVPETQIDKNKILVTSRDPGSANALIPVMEIMNNDKSMEILALTDGRAQEVIQKKFITKDITPQGMVLEADLKIGNLDLILTDASTSEQGLDTYSAATFQNVPMVLVEDYYTSSLKFLEDIKNRNEAAKKINIPLPEKICVMDEEAKRIIIEKFPDLASRVVVTGQPSFDQISIENIEQISQIVRQRLGLKPQEKLISFMSQMESPEMIKKMAQEIKNISLKDFYLVFRRHPRDNVAYEDYQKIFNELGIKIIDTQKFSTDEVSAASDIIITGYSTEGIRGIYRRKPTIHITDKNLQEIPPDLATPLPPVKLGASVGIDNLDELSESIDEILDPQNIISTTLKENMEKYYPRDSKNAQRVADVVYNLLQKNK